MLVLSQEAMPTSQASTRAPKNAEGSGSIFGSYGVNVGSGNGILVAPDLSVPHRGVPLTFT